ncbi:hypothetical protein GCM10010988_17820 [Cnuibacter physcomitrellae]|uniref:Uncharacterized protein n=1 Tax=Cnuibacter physcomitrellae TaxID=1619308 RepID=A0A1X9LQD2_9MICO|nr:DUF6069 family protein [Cnuibacter physcomitrellae]ARJ06518.1 hypothetical protein B5808_15800 [Cnuibacter physcomitrellae]GGI38203.1 hypothetical protein GCM10010988_17820 [Cnuibacter physcomitrellae]
MTASVATTRAPSRSRLRAAGILAAAAVVAVGLNAVVAAVATSLGAPTDYGPLTLPAYALFTVLGIAAGWAGWLIVRRRARDARRVLAVLVPVVTVLSLVPDVLLLTLRFIPGTTPAAAIALMVMHLAVVAVAVPAYALASRRA